MGVGTLLDFESFSKKGCFLSFEWEKQISLLLPPPLKKSLSASLEKILPTPMVRDVASLHN